MLLLHLFIAPCLASSFAQTASLILSAKPAEVILTGGPIFAESGSGISNSIFLQKTQAVALRNGEILAVGDKDFVLGLRNKDTVFIDLKGRMAMPGFHDGFVKIIEGGLNLLPTHVNRSNPLIRRQAYLKAQEMLLASGITSISGPISPEDIDILKDLALEGKILLRYELWGELESPARFKELKEKNERFFPQDFIRFGGVYGELDGSLEDRTAALMEPYADEPTSQGQPKYTQEQLNTLVITANRQGLAVILKASGDRAINMAITAFGNARKQLFNESIRNRIAGADVIAPAVRSHFGDLNITIVTTPSVWISEEGGLRFSNLLVRRLGRHRAKYSYCLKSLFKANANLIFGSLWPDHQLNPLLSIYAAKAGEMISKNNENLDLISAFRASTLNAAYATKEEHAKGGIREGKYADIIVLSQDPFKTNMSHFKNIQIDLTILAGKVVYNKNK